MTEDKLNDLAVNLDSQIEKLKLVKSKLNKRKNVIVFITVDRVSVYGNFKKCCDFEKLQYHSLKMKSFPIILPGVVIHKIDFK